MGLTWRILIEDPPTATATTPAVQVISSMFDVINGEPQTTRIGSPAPDGVSLDELISIYKWNIANTFKGSIGASQTVVLQTSQDGVTWNTVDTAQGSWVAPSTNDPLSAETASGKYTNTGGSDNTTPSGEFKRLWKAYEPLWILMIAGFSSAVLGIILITWYKHGAPLPQGGA